MILYATTYWLHQLADASFTSLFPSLLARSLFPHQKLHVSLCGGERYSAWICRYMERNTLVARGSVSFALFSLVFILREMKRTSGGTRYKSLFHADVAVWELAKPVLYFVTFLNFRVCHTTKIALFRLFAAQTLQHRIRVCSVWQPGVKY